MYKKIVSKHHFTCTVHWNNQTQLCIVKNANKCQMTCGKQYHHYIINHLDISGILLRSETSCNYCLDSCKQNGINWLKTAVIKYTHHSEQYMEVQMSRKVIFNVKVILASPVDTKMLQWNNGSLEKKPTLELTPDLTPKLIMELTPKLTANYVNHYSSPARVHHLFMSKTKPNRMFFLFKEQL